MKIQKFNESQDLAEMLNNFTLGSQPIWKLMNYLTENATDSVPDGVWDISDIDFIDPQPPRTNKWIGRSEKNPSGYEPLPNAEELIEVWKKSVIDFITKNPNFVVADAYQTEYPFFLAKMPTVKVKYIGSGFNHGANNIIENCPKRILICGEDD